MKARTLWAAALVLLLASSAWGQTSGEETPDEAAPAEDAFVLQTAGTHTLVFSQGVGGESVGFATPAKAPGLSSEVTWTAGTKLLKFVSAWTLDLSPLASGAAGDAVAQTSAGAGWGTDAAFDPTRSVRVTAGENALYWNPEPFKIGLGWQTWAWGSADGKNPTDVLNPRDYTRGLDTPRLPVFGLSAVWYAAEGVTWEAVIVPAAARDRWPVDAAAAIPDRLFYGLDTDGTNLLPQTGTGFERQVVTAPPAADGTATTAGTRLRLRLGGLDLAVSYVYGLDSFYTPRLTLANDPVNLQPGNSATGQSYWRVARIDLERLHQHHLGLDAKTTLGDFGLWAEGGLTLPEHLDLNSWTSRHPQISWTTGLDTSFGDAGQHYLNLQYFGEYVWNYDSRFGADYAGGQPSQALLGDRAAMERFWYRSLVQPLGNQTQGQLQGVLANLKLALAEDQLTLDLRAAGVVPTQYDASQGNRPGAVLLHPELDFKPLDSFHLLLGAELAYSWVQTGGDWQLRTAGDSLALLTPDNRLYFKAVYKWVKQ